MTAIAKDARGAPATAASPSTPSIARSTILSTSAIRAGSSDGRLGVEPARYATDRHVHGSGVEGRPDLV
jgi:hypothetical protein